MEVLKDRYTITELSERLHVTDHTLRYYEKEFSIKVPKDERGRRFYTMDLANIMYQIKNMREEGLEIKAIKKILLDDNIISEPPPVVVDENTVSVVPFQTNNNIKEIKQYFDEMKIEITSSIINELSTSKEYISKEITKSKLELGACVENSARKLEAKLERHFQEVDRSLSSWRERNKKGLGKKIFGGFLK